MGAAPENVECPSCDGEGFLAAPCADGETRRFECFDCDGTGQVTPDHVECPTCQGVGSSWEDHVGNCPDCNGTGRVTTENVEEPT